MRVHEALGLETGRSADKIAVESGVALSTVRALLPEFELAGLAERVDSGWKRSHTTAGRGDA
jgi:DNA processing protein